LSSHHIVRDKQEPALLIANGESCHPDLLGQLLEWSPYVVVLDSAIHRVMALGLKADVLLGDFDEATDDKGVDLEAIRQAQYPIEIVHTPDQEKTDLDKGIEFLIERGFPAVNIVWATGRRMDHTLTNLTNIVRYREQIKITLIDDYSVVYPLVGRYEKWFAKGTPISLIPVGTVDGIRTRGLMYNLDNETLILGFRAGSSNEAATDGFVSITAERGALLIMECRDR
jgi:thiamine pyrophosphokinase